MTDHDFEESDPPAHEPAPEPVQRKPAAPRAKEQSDHLELQVLGACLVEGDNGLTYSRALAAGITPRHFRSPAHRGLFTTLRESTDLGILVPTLQGRNGDSPAILQALIDATGQVPTTARADHFISALVEREQRADLERLGASIQERAKAGEAVEDLIQDLESFASRAPTNPTALKAQSLPAFILPGAGHPSILVGDRWLSRGDLVILASTSGMGKSSLTLQMCVCWALGLGIFGGFKPNGCLRVLIFQSEDSEGDVAEVWLSLIHAMKLTREQVEQVRSHVLIVTDRIHRGGTFRAELKRQVELHSPDLVVINPLLAFLGGDVNDSTDVGLFIREQLNSLNEPPRFGILIVHHTAKPPKERKERQWNEVMYEMAGSADLTNAAREILALQATDKEGEFKFIAAKRGRRAGLTKLVPGTVNPDLKFEAPTATIFLRHSSDKMAGPNGEEMRVIHWERADEPTPAQAKNKGGRPSTYDISDFLAYFPTSANAAIPAAQIWNKVRQFSGISVSGFKNLCGKEAKDGRVVMVDRANYGPCFWAPQV